MPKYSNIASLVGAVFKETSFLISLRNSVSAACRDLSLSPLAFFLAFCNLASLRRNLRPPSVVAVPSSVLDSACLPPASALGSFNPRNTKLTFSGFKPFDFNILVIVDFSSLFNALNKSVEVESVLKPPKPVSILSKNWTIISPSCLISSDLRLSTY